MVEKQTMMITAALAIVIVVAIGAIIYVNLPSETFDTDQQNQSSDETSLPDVTITMTFGEQELIYNLSALTDLEQYTGSGRYIKTKLLPDTVLLGDAHTFTGVTIQTLLEGFDELPENYTINVTASDMWVTEYTKANVLGSIDVYNENGTIIPNGTAIMLLAYIEDGHYYTEVDPDNETGPFRIVFVGENTPITSSALWSKKVASLEVKAVP